MVEWKGEINKNNSGQKAAALDQIQDLEVPNYFTITKEEIKQIIGSEKNPSNIRKNKIPENVLKNIEKAYDEVGISSEVRKSSGKAKNLVGGQRNSQKVSIRVSNSKPGSTKYKLNVGKSSLEKSLRQVIASFYEEKQQENYPAILVQKMIEPEKTGAIINNYDQNHQLIESVAGLGKTLEEGTTTPDFYLLKNQRIKERKIAQTQIKTTRHPLNGGNRTKQIEKSGDPYQQNEINKIAKKAASQNISLKFAYKRGTFYITDAFRNEPDKIYQKQPSLDLVKVSKGEITGTIGRQIKTAEKPLPPEQYSKILFSRTGAYTSRASQKARRDEKTLVVSYRDELTKGQTIGGQTQKEQEIDEVERSAVNQSVITATEVLPIDQGKPSINTQPPFTQGYSITSLKDTKGRTVGRENYLTTYQEIFEHHEKDLKSIAILDTRKISDSGIKSAIKYVEAEEKIALIKKPSREIIRTLIEEEYDIIGAEPSKIGMIEKEVARQEKKIILKDSLDKD